MAAGPFSLVAGTLLCGGLAAAVMAALPVRRIDPVEALKLES